MEGAKIVTLEGLRAYTQKYPQPDFNQNNSNSKSYIKNRVCHTQDYPGEYNIITPDIRLHPIDITKFDADTLITNITSETFRGSYKHYCRVNLNVDDIPAETTLVLVDYKKNNTGTGEKYIEIGRSEISWEEGKSNLLYAEWQHVIRDNVTRLPVPSFVEKGWYAYLPVTLGAEDFSAQVVREVVEIKIPKASAVSPLDYKYAPDLKKCMERIEMLEAQNSELIKRIDTMDKIMIALHPNDYENKKSAIQADLIDPPESDETINKIIEIANNSLSNAGLDQTVNAADIVTMKLTAITDKVIANINSWLESDKGKCLLSIVNGNFTITDINIDFDMPTSMSDGWLTMSANVNGIYLEETVTGWETLDMALRAVVSAICKKAGVALLKWAIDLF